MRYDIVTIVASRRGASALRDLVGQLPAHFGCPIVCLAHADPATLAELAASTALRVKVAEANEQLQGGCVYLPPPGASIVVLDDRRVALTPFDVDSTAQHPVDRFLGSAGRVFGARTLAIVLAAYLDDGAEGAYSLKWRGATVLVLDRATAEYYGMADPIVKAGSYDRILSAGDVANALRATFTGRDLLESAELQFELGLLLDSALMIAGTHMGNVQLAEPSAKDLHIVAHRGLGRRFLDRFGVVHGREESACARAMRLRRRVVIEDVLADREYAPYRDLAREAGYRAVQSTPIVGAREIDGMLSTLYPYPHVVSEHEARNLDEIAAAAGDVICNFR